jgi:hypothetical protein
MGTTVRRTTTHNQLSTYKFNQNKKATSVFRGGFYILMQPRSATFPKRSGAPLENLSKANQTRSPNLLIIVIVQSTKSAELEANLLVQNRFN